MKFQRMVIPILPIFVLCLLVAPGFGQDAKGDGGAEAAAKLRARFFARDFEAGFLEGARLMRQYPDSTAVKVWYVLNGSFGGRADEALELAEKMRAADDKDGWSWFALTAALAEQGEHHKEAVAASDKMIALLPANDDAVWLKAIIIREEGKVEDALTYIEKNLKVVKNPAELLVLKARSLYSQASSQGQ